MGSKRRTKEDAQKWHDENLPSHLTSIAKQRAKKNGLPFNITPDDVIIPDRCPLLGIVLKRSRKNRGPSDNSPTLDRIHPEKGYVKGNVWVISAKANRIKTDANLNEINELVVNLGFLDCELIPEAGGRTEECIGIPWALYESMLYSMSLPLNLSPSDFVDNVMALINQCNENKALLARVEKGLKELANICGERD